MSSRNASGGTCGGRKEGAQLNGKSLTSGLKSKNCRQCWGRDRECNPSWVGLAGRASLDGGEREKREGGRGKREEGRRLGLHSCRESHRTVLPQPGPGAAFGTAPSPLVTSACSHPQPLLGTSSFSVKTPFSAEIQQCPRRMDT